MSIMTIPANLYQQIYTGAVAAYIGQGMDLIAARSLAAEQMNSSFACAAIADDAQDSHDRHRDEMNWTDGELEAAANQPQMGGRIG